MWCPATPLPPLSEKPLRFCRDGQKKENTPLLWPLSQSKLTALSVLFLAIAVQLFSECLSERHSYRQIYAQSALLTLADSRVCYRSDCYLAGLVKK